jgi:hypothetical protein
LSLIDFAEMNVKKSLDELIVTTHATDRINERLGIKKKDAQSWATKQAEKARYLSLSFSAEGNPARLFAANGITLKVDLTKDVLITVFEPSDYKKSMVKDAIVKTALTELVKAEKVERRKTRSIQRYKAELQIEMSELEMALLKTKSLPKQLALQARINAIQMRIDDFPKEIHEVKRHKTRVSEGVAAYI